MTKGEIKKLDTLWRNAIKQRDEVCQLCGNNTYLNAHHVVGRRNRHLRWDLDNGILLCSGCHTFKTESAHQDPVWFANWFIEHYQERYNHIMKHRIDANKVIYSEILEKLTNL